MMEKSIPTFFIDLFSKIFGEKANLVMSIFMFSQSASGKKLISDIGEAFRDSRGERTPKGSGRFDEGKIKCLIQIGTIVNIVIVGSGVFQLTF